MRDLFDKLLAEGEAGIDRLVAERTQETVTLDFKEARGAGTGTLANEDRKTFAKALSAFANSAGGLLVFGVEARKGEDNVDCAQATKPISNIERFKSEATTASGQLLQPRHDGIVVEAIPSQKHPGAGYLLVYVERSERRPHQSQASGQKQYFKRAGDSSFEMEHYDIEDAFKRLSVPDLVLSVHKNGHVPWNEFVQHELALRITNVGSVTAKFPYLQIGELTRCSTSSRIRPTYRVESIERWTSFSGGADHVINPGQSATAGHCSVQVNSNNRKTHHGIELKDSIGFLWRLGCENTRVIRGGILIPWQDFPDEGIKLQAD